MSAVPRRFKSVIERIGDSYTVGANTRKAIVSVLPDERAHDFLTQAEIDLATKPLRLAYVPHDDGTVATDTATWDGISFSVKKVVKARFRGETVAKMLVWA
jgi:hypothetical protein